MSIFMLSDLLYQQVKLLSGQNKKTLPVDSIHIWWAIPDSAWIIIQANRPFATLTYAGSSQANPHKQNRHPVVTILLGGPDRI